MTQVHLTRTYPPSWSVITHTHKNIVNKLPRIMVRRQHRKGSVLVQNQPSSDLRIFPIFTGTACCRYRGSSVLMSGTQAQRIWCGHTCGFQRTSCLGPPVFSKGISQQWLNCILQPYQVFILFIYYFFGGIYVCADQRTAWEGQLFPFTPWVPGIESRLSGPCRKHRRHLTSSFQCSEFVPCWLIVCFDQDYAQRRGMMESKHFVCRCLQL